MNFSFNSILSKIVNILVDNYNFVANLVYHGKYGRIAELIAFMFQKLAYTVDVYFLQGSLVTATIRRFAVKLAESKAYRPHRKQGATGKVRMSADSTFSIPFLEYTGETVVLDKYHQFTNQAKTTTVYLTESYTYPKGVQIINDVLDAGNPVNLGSGKVGLPCTAHGMPIGQTVNIFDTTYYQGSYTIDPDTTVNQIVIEASYTDENFTGAERINTGDTLLSVKEGIIKSIDFTAKGEANEKFYIYSSSVDNDTLEIQIIDSITGVVLQTVPYTTGLLVDITDSYYAEIRNDAKYELVYVQFGDGIKSAKTLEGLKIRVIYAETQGDLGNITSSGIITASKDTLLDLQGNTPSIYFTNDEAITNGTDIESINSIKTNAIEQFQAGYRAAGKGKDWAAMIKNYPGIVKAIAWSEATLRKYEISSNANIMYFSAVTSTGDDLTSTQELDLIYNFLDPDKDPTIYLKRFPLKKVYIGLEIDAKINKVQKSLVASTIFQSLYSNYSILNTNFGTDYSIYSSKLDKVVQEDPNVVYHSTLIYHIESSQNYIDIQASTAGKEIVVSRLSADEPLAKNQVYLQSPTLEVWVERKISGVWQTKKMIGETNIGTPTTIDGVNGYTISASIINYSTNKVTFTINDIISDAPPSTEPDADLLEITNVTTVADIAGSLGGKYFLINSHANSYYVWINVDGGSVDPAPIGLTGIMASITSGDNAAAVASAIDTAILGVVDLTSTVLSNVVTISTTQFAVVTDASDVDTGFTITVIQQGTADSTFGVINPTENDPTGYVLELRYKTQDGNGKFLNDIRLPYFYLITDIKEEDIITNFTY